MSDELIERVRKHLETSGFPFELQVARTLRALKFNVAHQEHYLDEATGKHREIDLVARRVVGDPGAPHILALTFVVECKYISAAPWIILTSDDSRPTRRGSFNTPANKHGSILADNVWDVPLSPFWTGPVLTGYGTLALSSKSPDDRGRVDAEATPADAARAARAVEAGRSTPRSPMLEALLRQMNGIVAEIYVPVVVVRGSMTTAWLGDNANIKVEPTAPWARLNVQPPRVATRTVVDIVEESMFEEYVSHALSDMPTLVEVVGADPDRVLEEGLALKRLIKDAGASGEEAS